MTIAGKIWGQTELVEANGVLEFHRTELNKETVSVERLLDKFYTKPRIAETLIELAESKIPDFESYFFIEPSAGDGSFSNILFSKGLNCEAIDIHPQNTNIVKKDFLSADFQPAREKKIITIGNPPFGKNSKLAVSFFNKSASFSRYICFVLPLTFKKESVINRLNTEFHLEFENILPENSFTFQSNDYNVPCLFQIWKKQENLHRKKIISSRESDYFTFTTKENAQFAVRRVGGLAGKVILDFENYSKNSHYYIRNNNIIDLDHLIEIFTKCEKKFRLAAQNTAGNPSLSKTEIIKIIDIIKD